MNDDQFKNNELAHQLEELRKTRLLLIDAKMALIDSYPGTTVTHTDVAIALTRAQVVGTEEEIAMLGVFAKEYGLDEKGTL